MIGFALCHGWAFDASVMEDVAASLRTCFPQAPIAVFDLGFTGQPSAPSLADATKPDTQWIAIGHSYGFAYLMQQPLIWHAAVSLNGFTRFCRHPGQPEGMPVRLLDAMLARLEAEPHATVTEFRQRCGSEPAVTQSLDVSLNVPLLAAHLQQLRDLDVTLPPCPVLSLSTREDVIVPPALTQACFMDSACMKEEYAGGHLALLHDAPICRQAIAAFMEKVHA